MFGVFFISFLASSASIMDHVLFLRGISLLLGSQRLDTTMDDSAMESLAVPSDVPWDSGSDVSSKWSSSIGSSKVSSNSSGTPLMRNRSAVSSP